MGSLKYALVIGKLQLWHLNTNTLKVIHEFLCVSLETIRVQRPQTHPDQNAGGDYLIIERYFTNITDLISVIVIFCAYNSALIIFQELLINCNSTNWTDKAPRVIKRITRTNNPKLEGCMYVVCQNVKSICHSVTNMMKKVCVSQFD